MMDRNHFLEFNKFCREVDHKGKTDLLISQFAYNDSLTENFFYQINTILKFIYSDQIIDKDLYIEICDTARSNTEKFRKLF